MTAAPDLILHHGMFTTLDRANPTASAVAVRDGKFLAVGNDKDVMALAGAVAPVGGRMTVTAFETAATERVVSLYTTRTDV